MLVSIPQLRSIPNAGYNLLPHLTSTVVRYVIGVAIGAPLGIVVGLSMGWSRTVNDLVRAPLELVRVTPPLVALPFCLLWFGSGEMSKVFLIASYCFLILVINTFTVIQNVPLVYSRFARTLGATPAHVYLTVILPASVPGIIGGVRVVMAFAWGLEIVGELMGGQFGLGRLAMIFMSYFSPESLMAVMVWIILVGICIDRLVYAVLRHVTRWMPEASHIG
jgi:ABC-type nitrate/sulfonate/bicarbonate transport system permease component